MESIYTRLDCTRRTPVSKATLWMASDHLLSVESSRIGDEYRRYYFRDIQALVLQKQGATGLALIQAVLIILIVVAMLVAYLARWFTLIPGVLIVVTMALAYSMRDCRCLIVTRANQAYLPAMAHWRQSQAVVEQLTALIMEVQRQEAPAPREEANAGSDPAEML